MTNEQLANQWVNHILGRNNKTHGNGSHFSYSYNVLYSYNSTLAEWDQDKKVLLINDHIANYSNTSKRHALHMERALMGENITKLYLYGTLVAQTEMLRDLILKQERARKYDYTNEINELIQNIDLYVEYLNVDKRTKEYKEYLNVKRGV